MAVKKNKHDPNEIEKYGNNHGIDEIIYQEYTKQMQIPHTLQTPNHNTSRQREIIAKEKNRRGWRP